MNYVKVIEEIELKYDFINYLSAFKTEKYFGILDSSMQNKDIGRYSIIFADPYLILKGFAEKSILYNYKTANPCQMKLTGNPINIFNNIYAKYNIIDDIDFPFFGGAIGFFGYELLHFNSELKSIGKMKKHPAGIPLLQFAFYDTIFINDNLKNRSFIISTGIGEYPEKECREIAIKKKDKFKKLITSVQKQNSINSLPDSGNLSRIKQIKIGSYIKKIKKIKKYIRAGEIFQACFTYQKKLKYTNDPLLLYLHARSVNPAPFSAFFDFNDFKIICCSPERFFRKTQDNMIETRPIKGTRKRGRNSKEDNFLKKELKESIKDQAENIMITDLLRNDIGKCSCLGSVRVTELFKIEEYSNVFQLVSIIKGQGKMKGRENVLKYFKSLYPGGSMTGAPKHRALEILNRLEKGARGIYSGSIGYLGFNNSIDLNIVIRTIILKNNQAYIGTGGGIVYDSNPECEYEETNVKVSVLIDLISKLNNCQS